MAHRPAGSAASRRGVPPHWCAPAARRPALPSRRASWSGCSVARRTPPRATAGPVPGWSVPCRCSHRVGTGSSRRTGPVVPPAAGGARPAAADRSAVSGRRPVTRQQLFGAHPVDLGQLGQPLHGDRPVRAFVGAHHDHLEPALGPLLDLLQRSSPTDAGLRAAAPPTATPGHRPRPAGPGQPRHPRRTPSADRRPGRPAVDHLGRTDPRWPGLLSLPPPVEPPPTG